MAGVTPLIVAPFHFNEYLNQLPRSLSGKKGALAGGPDGLSLRSERAPGKMPPAISSRMSCTIPTIFRSGRPQALAASNRLRHDPREVSKYFIASPSSHE